MTVAELIAELQKHDPNACVMFEDAEYGETVVQSVRDPGYRTIHGATVLLENTDGTDSPSRRAVTVQPPGVQRLNAAAQKILDARAPDKGLRVVEINCDPFRLGGYVRADDGSKWELSDEEAQSLIDAVVAG